MIAIAQGVVSFFNQNKNTQSFVNFHKISGLQDQEIVEKLTPQQRHLGVAS